MKHPLTSEKPDGASAGKSNQTNRGKRSAIRRLAGERVTMIRNCHKNIMGTVSFDGQFHGMRKPQDFIVYPMQDSGAEITIQSDHRFGRIDLDSGKGILSANRAQYANSVWLAVCVRSNAAVPIELVEEERETLRQWVKSTGGVMVGESIVHSDNTGAIAL